MAPMISVITVVKNKKAVIEKTICSVIRQDYPNYEYIVVDGSSDDGTTEIINKYEQYITHYIREKDGSLYGAMNKALGKARGTWVLFMNGGDCLARGSVLSGAAALFTLNTEVVFSDWIDEKTGWLHYAEISKMNFNHQAVIYKKALHEQHGMYVTSKNVTIADYLFFSRIDNCKWTYCDRPFAICESGGLSAKTAHYQQRLAADFILGRRTRVGLIAMLMFHPIYHYINKVYSRLVYKT